MPHSAFPRCHGRVQRALDQRVGEGEILALVQQRRGPQGVGERGRAGLGETGQGGGVAQRRAPSEDGNSAGQRARPVRQPG